MSEKLLERVSWEEEEQVSLRKNILKFLKDNAPMVKRSSVVHEFAKEYRGGTAGVSRTYIYEVINSLITGGFVKPNSGDPNYLELDKVISDQIK